MNAQPRKLLRRLARGLVSALLALAVCLGPVGCADIKIDAGNLKIPGLTAADPGAEGEKPADVSGVKTFGDVRYRVEF